MKVVMRKDFFVIVVFCICFFSSLSQAQVVTYSVNDLQAMTVDTLVLDLTPAQLVAGDGLDDTYSVGTQLEDSSDAYNWISSMTRREAASAIDGNWIQTDSDEIWEFDIPTNRVVVGNPYDHDRFSSNLSVMYLEALEYTVWGGNDKDASFNGASNPGDWELALIILVYQQGYNQNAVWDDYTAELSFPSGSAYKYVHVVANSSISIDGNTSGDDEIDFVARPQVATNISEIPDGNLKTKLQELVGDQDLSTVTTLDLSNSGIEVLAGLHLFPQLTELDIKNNQIERLDYIYNLSELKKLNADNNQIETLSALTNLTKLTEVSLKNNQVIDANPLAANTGISGTINMEGNPLSNVSMTTAIPALVGRGLTVVYDLVQTSQQGEIVTFADSRLERKIRSILGIPYDNPLMKFHLEQLTDLNLDNSLISDLTGLETCLNLQILRAESNQISDLSPLSQLTKLRELYLSSNQITDASPLQALTQLKTLYLSGNKSLNLSPLPQLTQLNNLELYDCQLTDISTLEGLNQLTYLHLENNQITDISPLVNLSQLNSLNLHHNQITDISSLANLSNLESLHLYNNKLTNLPDMSNLNKIRHLDLGNNGLHEEPITDSNSLTDISNLSGLTSLTWLGIHDNQVTNINALSTLNQLTELYIRGNQITDISALKNLNRLRHLEAQHNKITTISEIMHWTNVYELRLYHNQITGISGLAELPNLEYVHLQENLIANISPLANSPKLRYLNLNNNQISDLSPLQNLTNLYELHLGYNQISDLSPLQNLTALQGTNLNNNHIIDLSPLTESQAFGQNGGWVYFSNNPLSNVSVVVHLPILQSRNLSLNHNGWSDNRLALADFKVEMAIRQAVDKPLPEQKTDNLSHLLTTEENLTDLDLSYLGVTDLSGLETLTNLQSVDISGHQIAPSLLTQQTALLQSNGIGFIKLTGWLAHITAKSEDSTVDPQTVSFGVSEGASDGVDDGLDIPSPPPIDVSGGIPLNSHFETVDTGGINLIRDFRGETDGPISYTLKLRADQDGFVLTWDLKAIPRRYNSVRLRQTSPTTALVIDLLQEKSATLAATASSTLTFELTVREAVGVELAPGWNLISIPGQPLETNPQSLVNDNEGAGVVLPLYRWDPSTFNYQEVEELKVGEGYWILTTNQSVTNLVIPYQPVDSYTQLLLPGWNMIGSLSQSTDFSQPSDTPAGSIFPQSLFGWQAAGFSYQLSNQIEPGQGYWVLASVFCQLTVQAGTTTATAPMVAQTAEFILPLMVQGLNFNRQLHLGLDTSSNKGLDKFDQLLPPISPNPISNMVQLVQAGHRLTQDVQPIREGSSWTLEWNLQQPAQLQLDLSQLPASYQLVMSQAEEAMVLQTGETVEIAIGQGQFQFYLQPRISQPEATRLLQNFPNPFNPETWIPFDLAEDAEVNIDIYDAKGDLVRRLSMGNTSAGAYRGRDSAAYWDGRNKNGEQIASGTYFYQIHAGHYRDIRKMVILK